MSDAIAEEINLLRSDIPKIAELSDEFLFSLLCLKYFYNEGQLDYKDYRECYVDGRADGGVDAITIEEDDQEFHLILLQSKYSAEIANKQDVVDIFTKMHQTCRDFFELRTSQYNKRLKRIFKDRLAQLEGEAPIYHLVLFVRAEPGPQRRDVLAGEERAREIQGAPRLCHPIERKQP